MSEWDWTKTLDQVVYEAIEAKRINEEWFQALARYYGKEKVRALYLEWKNKLNQSNSASRSNENE